MEKRTLKEYKETTGKNFNTLGLKETCLNCGKNCSLARVGNQAGLNENNGCWVQIKKGEVCT